MPKLAQLRGDSLALGAGIGIVFRVVEPIEGSGVRTLASFRWHLKEAGAARLRVRSLPERFPAVLRRTDAGEAYYFAGDFADNPLDMTAVPFAGYPTLKRWIEAGRLAPAEDSFYWRFYAPMMTRLLDHIGGEQPGDRP